MAGRRSNGDGAIRQMESGRWRGQVMDGYTDDGKRKFKSFSGDTKKEILQKIRDFHSQKEASPEIEREMTFAAWSEEWYLSYRNQVQPSTYSNYKYTIKLLNKHLGTMKLTEILPIRIMRIMDTLKSEGYSKSQISKCRTMLIQIFDAAEDNNLLTRNPARRTKPPKDLDSFTLKPKTDKDAFTKVEIQILFNELPCNLPGHSIRLMLLTGIRVQELLALTVDDIPEDGSSLNIDKAVKTVDNSPMLGPPKSKHSVRVIPVPASGRASAQYLRSHGGHPFIWTQSIRHPLYSVNAFRKAYYKIIKPIDGVRNLSPHCCRHTYVTQLQAKGVAMEIIAKLSGHADIATTDGYLHMAEDIFKTAVEGLGPNNNTNETCEV